MATSEVVIEADSGFARSVRSPGSSLNTKINKKDMRSFEKGAENDVIGEGLFSFDEDIMPDIERGKLDEKDTTITRINVEPGSHDSGHFEMSHANTTSSGEVAGLPATRMRHTGNPWAQEKEPHSDSATSDDVGSSGLAKSAVALGYGTSLPITIPAGRFWPPRDAVDSIKDRESTLDCDECSEAVDKTVLPQRPPKDLYSEMRAHARSIQAVDDPERLFGERPSRRRYQTGQASTSQAKAPLQSYCEGAKVVFAANVKKPI